MIGRVYLDPGDRISGRFAPPRRCVVLVKWGPGGGPRNVLVRYLDDGAQAVIPFPRRLRRVSRATDATDEMDGYPFPGEYNEDECTCPPDLKARGGFTSTCRSCG